MRLPPASPSPSPAALPRVGSLLRLLLAGAVALACGACDRGGPGSGGPGSIGAAPSGATSAGLSAATAALTPRRGGTLVTGWTAEPGGVNTLITPATSILDELSLQLFLRLVEEQSDF